MPRVGIEPTQAFCLGLSVLQEGPALLNYSTSGNPAVDGDLPILYRGLNLVDVWGIEPQLSPHWMAPLR